MAERISELPVEEISLDTPLEILPESTCFVCTKPTSKVLTTMRFKGSTVEVRSNNVAEYHCSGCKIDISSPISSLEFLMKTREIMQNAGDQSSLVLVEAQISVSQQVVALMRRKGLVA